MADWIETLKSRPLVETARALGLDVSRSAFGPCPQCGEDRRGHADRRLPCGILRNGERWTCNRCHQGGNALDLVAWAILGKRPPKGDVEGWKAVRAWVEGAPLEPLSPNTTYSYPDPAAVAALWQALRPIGSASDEDHLQAEGWLRSRGYDLYALRDLDLVRIYNPKAGASPLWPGTPWLVALPLYSAIGIHRSFRWRAVQEARPKGRTPKGFSAAELVLADPIAHAEILTQRPNGAGLPWNRMLVITEGEPDFLTWAGATGRVVQGSSYAVLGISSGSWSDVLAARIPNGTTVLIRTHPDPAGRAYAVRIWRSLQARQAAGELTVLARSDWTKGQDDNALHQQNQLYTGLPDPTLSLTQASFPVAADEKKEPAQIPWIPSNIVLPSTEPPPPRWFFSLPPSDMSLQRKGILPLGKVGILGAKGGTGKTSLLCWLALSVATGKPWIGGWRVTAGRVAMILGEEDATDVSRKLYYQARVMGLNEEELELARRRIFALGGAGIDLALVRVDSRSGEVTKTPFAIRLFAELQEAAILANEGYSAILLDPLARFGGVDCEEDAGAATRLIENLETLRTLPGPGPLLASPANEPGPVVLVAHHTRKPKSGEVAGGEDDDLRGSSALRDGARWVLSITNGPGSTIIKAKVTKSNVGWIPEPLYLYKEAEDHGALRDATTAEVLSAQESKAMKKQLTTKTPGQSENRGDDA